MQEILPTIATRVVARLKRLKKLIVLSLIATFLFSIPAGPLQAAAGELDPQFGKNGKLTTDFTGNGGEASGVAVQQDGKIVAAGTADDSVTRGDFVVSRYNTDGSLDTGFGTNGKVRTDILGTNSSDLATALAIQNDGKIVVGGDTIFIGLRFVLVRYNGDGSLDSSFGTGGKVVTDIGAFDDSINALVLQPDGKIIAVGVANTTFSPSGPFNFALARYNPDGSLDTTFGTGGKVITDFNGLADRAYAAALQQDGRIVVAGSVEVFSQFPELRNFALARYNPDGSLDTGFGSGGKVTTDFFGSTDEAFGVTIQQDGKIIAGGGASDPSIPSGADFGLARYNPNGSLDPSFGTNGKVMTDFLSEGDGIRAIALLADGKILAAGHADDAEGNGITDFALAQYNADGSLDSTFGAGGRVRTDFFVESTDWINAIAIQADGKIVVAGRAENDFALARYLGCTALLSSASAFFPATGGEESVTMIIPSDCTWAASSGENWINITSTESGNGTVIINYLVRDNPAPGGRQGTLTIAGQVFHITQAGRSGGNCSFVIAPKFESFSIGGGSGAISVTSNVACAWQAKSNVKWIVISSGCCGIGNGTVTYLVSPNTTGGPRKGIITIAGKTFSIKQLGA